MDLLQIKKTVLDEKQQVSIVETKIDHSLSDSTEIKSAVIKAAEKIEKRLEEIEELLNKITDLKPKVLVVSPMALSLAPKGYEPKKPTIPLLERSYSFGMLVEFQKSLPILDLTLISDRLIRT